MADEDKICNDLVFFKDSSASRRAKARDFWKFLDSQEGIHPYRPSQDDGGTTRNETTSTFYSNLKSETGSKVELPRKNKIWYNELQNFHQLGLDRVALVANDSCKRCRADAKLRDNMIDLADTVAQPYEEIKADIKNFEKRTRNQDYTCAYNMPEKYQHLIP